MHNRGIATTLMLMALLLITTGLTYAHWTETITIDATVETGELDWHIKDAYVARDNDDDTKDVADTTVTLIDSDGDGDNDTLGVKISNAYPCYEVSITFYAENCGTVPLIVKELTVICAEGTFTYTKAFEDYFDLDGDGVDDIYLYYGNNFGVQLDPGDPPLELSFKIHIEQGAPEGKTLEFTMKLVAENWSP